MNSPRIALATCRELPSFEVDDRPLHRALEGLGAEVHQPVWDDPAVAWEAFDACLVRTTWDYSTKIAAFHAWVQRAAERTRLFNPPEILRGNTDKSYLLDLAREGWPVAPTRRLRRGEPVDVEELAASEGWDAAFLKPVVGAAAQATLRFVIRGATPSSWRVAEETLRRSMLEGLATSGPSEDLLLQPYLPSVATRGEVSLIAIDGRPSHWVRKVPVPGDYRVQDDFDAHDAPYRPRADEEALAGKLLRSLPDLLYARVDLLDDLEGRPVINELELTEPSLFFRHRPEAAEELARALLARL